MKYAIVQLAGKQLKVSEGDVLSVNKMDSYVPQVLLYSVDGAVQLGSPALSDITVNFSVIGEKKVKTIVGRFKAKSRYHKTTGHKQPMAVLRVESILGKGEVATKKEIKREEKVEKQEVAKTPKTVKAAPKKTATPKASKKPVTKKEKA